MTKIKIVTDSSITIASEWIEQLDITIVPLSVMVDGVVYSDADLSEGEFLQLMRQSKTLPKTSQPPVGVFAEVFSDLAKDGSRIVSIHLSQSLSGTVEAARQGAILSGADVTVIDSTFTDQALAFQVMAAARLAQAGESLDSILSVVEQVRGRTELYLGLSTLENLVKGGRIGRVTGLLGSLLQIRVVMQLVDDQLHPVLKGRGQKTFQKWLGTFSQHLSQHPVEEIGISYAGEADLAQELKETVQPFVEKEITVLETGSIIQTHTGENAWAILVRYKDSHQIQ